MSLRNGTGNTSIESKVISPGIYFRTVRHLRPQQVFYQAYYRLKQPWNRLLSGTSNGAHCSVALRRVALPSPLNTANHSALPAANGWRFCFLNREVDFSSGIAWDDANLPKLWRYKLHYFDYLNDGHFSGSAEALTGRLALMEDWIEQNPVYRGTAWEPYPTSLRIVNWLRFLTQNRAAMESHPPQATRRILASLFEQAAILERNLEFHLLGNHLIKNAKALLFAGALLECAKANSWFRRGGELLASQVKEQILADGGHFERSPMYHAIVLEDFLDILDLLDAAQLDPPWAKSLREKIAPMADFLAGMSHADGEIALFNDSVQGEAAPAAALLKRAEARTGRKATLPCPLCAFPSSGYFVLSDSAGSDRMILDCGPLGPDYQPGHGHCDLLSYELSLAGRRVVTDSGVFGYEADDFRQYARSTLAHNTVSVDSREQSEMWASFRVGRRARPLRVQLQRRGDLFHLSGAHDGFESIGVTHCRHVVHSPHGPWIILDEIAGCGSHRVTSAIHFHPEISLQPLDGGERCGNFLPRFAFSVNGAGYRLCFFGRSQVVLSDSPYFPEFGRAETRSTVVAATSATLPSWMGYAFIPEGFDEQQLAFDFITRTLRVGPDSLRLSEAQQRLTK